MIIADLHSFLVSLEALLRANQGAKVATEFAAFCSGLEPFKELSVGDFAAFLRQAEEFKRTGQVPIPADGKRPKAGAASAATGTKPKQPLRNKNDHDAINQTVERLKALQARFADPSLSQEEARAEVDRAEREFDGEGLKAVARAFGIKGSLSSKTAARDRLHEAITERKARHERAAAFAAPPAPAKLSTPASPKAVVPPVVEVAELAED